MTGDISLTYFSSSACLIKRHSLPYAYRATRYEYTLLPARSCKVCHMEREPTGYWLSLSGHPMEGVLWAPRPSVPSGRRSLPYPRSFIFYKVSKPSLYYGKQRHLRTVKYRCTIAAGKDCTISGPNLVRGSGASDASHLVAPHSSMTRTSSGRS